MRPTRKTVISGLVGLGLIGALAGGVGIASAATAATAPGTSAASTPSPTPPYGGRFGGMHGGMAAGQAMPITAAATYLGLSQTDLQTQLQAGKSLADVAKARGKSVSGLEDAMVAAITSNINANSALSADQKSAMLAQAKTRIATMVTTAHPDGAGCGPMGGHMGGMAGMGQGA
jgi:cytochrome c553